ncbi:DUF5719 family protein, partial [Angustibacter aerolatus]
VRSARAATSAAAGVSVQATGAAAAELVGDQWTLALQGDLRGLATAPCRPGSADSWLVGGGSEPGRRGRLVLVNPAGNPVDVELDVHGTKGRAARTAGSAVAVPARSRVVVLLDAIAPGVTAPVVHVRVTGGVVAATLHDALLSGTTPGGVDDVVPGTGPARRVLVPGVAVDGVATVRVAAPGRTEAVAQLRLIGPTGPVDVPGGGVLRVPGGASREVSLTGVPPGEYGVEVTSDTPVVAGAEVRRQAAGRSVADIAWAASADPVTGVAGTALAPPGVSTRLLLTAPRDTVEADVVTGTGASTRVRVPAGTTLGLAQDGVGAVWVRPLPGSGDPQLVAARLVSAADPQGLVLSTSPLQPVHLTEQRPAVEPSR